MAELSEDFKRRIEEESWDSVAQMALGFQINITNNSKECRRLSKQLGMVKHLIHEHLRKAEDVDKFLNASFFVRLVKTLDSMEKSLKKYNIEKSEFLIFLKAVLHKLKKERLVVSKTLERKNEFRKLKVD